LSDGPRTKLPVPPAGNGVAPDGAMRLLLDLEAAGACTPVALDLTGVDLTWERYVGVLALLGTLHRRIAFYVGDALNDGERRFGEALKQGWSRERLREALRDADALPRAGRVALGEAQANATQRLTAAARGVLGAARQVGDDWLVPGEAWAALVEAV